MLPLLVTICLSIRYVGSCTANQLYQIDCRNVRGFYQDADNQRACKLCPPGYYCPYGAADKIVCPAGSYSTGGTEFCTLCLPGFYCPDINKPTQLPCMMGWYTDQPGQDRCTICPRNYECIGNTKLPCWDGTGTPFKWSNPGEGRCRYFAAGYKPSSNVLASYIP